MDERPRWPVWARLAAIGLVLFGYAFGPMLVMAWEDRGCAVEVADCCSNVNQLSKALAMYAEDYDGRLPQTWFDADGNGRYDPDPARPPSDRPMQPPDGHHDYAWAWALFHYTKSLQICTCNQFPINQNWDGRFAPSTDRDGISYGLNCRLGEVGGQLAQIGHPSHTVTVCDLAEDLQQPWLGLPDAGNDPDPDNLGNVALRADDRHGCRPGVRRIVVGYADGHAKAVTKDTLLLTGSGAAGNPWAPKR